MKSKKQADLTIEELNKQKKLLTGVLAAFIIVMVIAYSVLLWLMIRNDSYTLFAIIPLGFVILLPAMIKLSQINTKLKLRSNQNE